MNVFDTAKQRAAIVRERGDFEVIARLVHSATLGNSMTTMIAGAVNDGHMTRKEGERALASATAWMKEFERMP
jgi:hypothetical protein